ncbi:ABC transporter permease [Nocardiopsis terrae]|uniref:ABC-2 family transporter protein n=1 Tax=Nocardiopsis terrae TaxID=372655 RepID=A0ABR9HAC9_9ACTN|nr:ABC transporter permease [Nocardiopsis terrae]MBE1455980.1 hypothetical protein [Nocardiopsis terrae]GHC96397.1 ABC transporter permease [Nocardiopsis terrae]
MIPLLKAELRKTFTTRVWWILLLAALAWTGLMLAGTFFVAGMEHGPGRDSAEYGAMAWPQLANGTTFALVIGVLMVTTEYQHRTVNVTFLVTPERGRVIGAKLVTAALVGVGFGLTVAVLGGSAVAASILSAGGSLDLAANEVPRVVGGTIAAYGVYTMIGVGVGALVRNQVAAVVACLLWVFMVEPAFMVVPNEVVQTIGSWMPGIALASLYSTSSADFGFDPGQFLPVWVAALALVGYAVLASLAASFTTARRDLA